MRILVCTLFWLLLPLASQAEYSHTYLDSYPLEIASVGQLEIAYRIVEEHPDRPKAVVIMGLGGSNIAWGDALISGLAAQGYEVLLLDNRDTGASTRFDDWGQPTLWWELLKYKLGFSVNAPYTLNDMATDITGLMTAVGYDQAHIIGASMGGMIAQIVAARHPEKTQSSYRSCRPLAHRICHLQLRRRSKGYAISPSARQPQIESKLFVTGGFILSRCSGISWRYLK